MKKIILSIAAGFMTLSLGLAIFYAGQFLSFDFSDAGS